MSRLWKFYETCDLQISKKLDQFEQWNTNFFLQYNLPCVTGVLGRLRSTAAKQVTVGDEQRKGDEVDNGDNGSSS